MAIQTWNAVVAAALLVGSASATRCPGGEWDVIVVGSGPAGIVAADRMSEAGKRTLLLEQGGPSYYVTGGRTRPNWLEGTELSRVDVPGLYKTIFSNPGQGLVCPSNVVNAFQGCTVGGNTAINAGLFFQPPASDWDKYFPEGWKNKDMQGAIQKVRETQPSTDSPSLDGQRYLQSGYETAKKWLVDGAGYADVGLNDGPSEHSKTKVFGHPIWNYEGGQRSGPVKTYLQQALKRSNFAFRTGTKVLRVRRDGDIATGVDVEFEGTNHTSICLKQGGVVISSAGALLSPQLLMWSGIGNVTLLEGLAKNGQITVPPQDWINNTAVGDKVFDNPNTFIELHDEAVTSFVYDYSNPPPTDAEMYLKNRSGPYTFASQTSAFWDYIQQGEDLVGCQGTIDSSGAFDYGNDNNTITLNVYGTSGLRSFGRVGLDDRGIALPSSNFFADPRDVNAIATFIHNIFQALPETLTPLNIAKNSTVDEIESWLKTPSKYTLGNVQHWSSSCRMDECVDADTKVIGMQNLFVVDASIVPPLTTNPVMGVMIAAERAVEKILPLMKTLALEISL
ncbi:cellobiose dehydrogenase [Bipolaris sorokiniana ND90Pr]|uniref:Cellobiose dehydrogenase n=1 Tax=Cochliobolus sativus (strain ND90Pr / ATCC 201652) TaxID=665912 RepID=M2SG23_COCSN|nr:cellobiose dehydrogenase [Bipolaris sorokiniana ND90Pr]EMD66193.1 cellobiose dehydrogenase [Bipolaris sorokiniana ND90Pr]